MDIKIDRVFLSQVPTSPFQSDKVFKTVSINRFKTRKPFDLKILSDTKKKPDLFNFWIKNPKEQDHAAKNFEAHLDELLKTTLPLQSFELTMAYKSNKTTYQPPIPLWIQNTDQTSSTNPLLVDYLIYERVKDEILKIQTETKPALPANLMIKGRLLMNESGYFYLKFKESSIKHYLHSVYHLENSTTNFCENHSQLGFHMGIIMPHEYKNKKLWGKIKEVGKEFYVTIQGYYQIILKDHPEYEKLWVLQLDCPLLNNLREKHGLCPYLNGHAFMLVLGYKKRIDFKKIEPGCYRINPAIFAV